MEEENEVLDWEDDEEQTQAPTAEDDADGVSLGSGSDDENEAHSQLATVEEPRNLPVAVSGQRDSSGITRQVTVPPPVSQSQQNVHTEEPTKPHSSSISRRDTENSGISDSNASPAPKSSRRRPKKTREPPTSTLPKVHGLPPKPVASTPAFVAPSHPSLTEATAMSQSKGKNGLSSVPSGNSSSKATGDQRPHSSGSNNKPPSSKTSSGPENSLPPDWQLRQSRSSDAVYYYNTRTHECTWVKPAFEPSDSSKERNALTFEDRHYRPAVVDDTSGSSRHGIAASEAQVSSSARNDRGPPKDNWFGRSGFHEEEDGDSDDSYRGRSARDRRGRRSPSPVSPHRSRDVDMDVRGTRHSTSQRRHDRVSRATVGDREKEYTSRIHEPEHNRSGAEEFRIHDFDRHWAPRDELHSHSRPGYDQAPDAHKLAAKSSRRHPPASPQEFLPQAHGHRQHDRAEPHSHEQSREERKRNAYPPTASRSRDIDSWEQRQPQNSLSSTNRHRSPSPPHPMLMTATGLPPPPLAATNSATLISTVSTSTSGRRNKPSRFAPASAVSVPEDVDDWVPDEFRTEATDESRTQDTENARKRTRESEREIREPKSDHFLDEHRRSERARSASPTVPASPDIPASRRRRQPLPPQSMRFREMTSGGDAMQRDPPPHRDRGRSSKFGPPLITPTASSTTNARTEIDSAITPSAPRAFDTLEPPPPSGPRGRSRSFDGDGSHTRGRPYPRRERSRGRSRSYSRSRSRSMEREREAERVKRGDSTVEVPKGPRAMEHSSIVDSGTHESQGRRPHLPVVPLPPVAPANRGRGKGRSRRGREQVTATGTNNIPVGTRGTNDTPALAPPRYTSQHDSGPPSVPPKGLTGGNVIPLKSARTRVYGSKTDEDIVEPLRSYSRSRSRTPPRRTRESPVRRDERDAIEIDRPRRPSRVRRESFSEVRYDTSSFTAGYEDPPPPGGRTGTDSHRWSKRDSPARYRQREVSERTVTPPPSSRAASYISPYQDRDEDRRLDRQRNADSMEDVRVSHDYENNQVREESNSIADNGQDGKQNGFKMQHPLPMNPMLLRIGPTTPVQPTGPSTSPSTSYPRHRDRSPAPLPPPLVSSTTHLPGFSQDSSESLPVPRQSKPPVKIRRPPPLAQEMSSFPNPLTQPTPMVLDEPDRSNHRRQSPRRGGSLLDRLSGGVGNREDNMTPSLKDRVLVPSKRDRGELDEPVDSDRHNDYHNGNNGWDGADDGERASSALPYESGGGKRRRPYRGGGSSRKPRRSNKMST